MMDYPPLTLDEAQALQQFAQASRLYAAAPDLLAACLAMIKWDDAEKTHEVDFGARQDLCAAAFDAARAAIAKATGQ